MSGERLHRFWVQAVLFLLTLYTTLAAGSRIVSNFERGLPAFRLQHDLSVFWSVWNQPGELARGWPYAGTLLAILLAHEFGHWMVCRRYRIEVSLPYCFPVPVFIGTAGAFLRFRGLIYTRRQLFDIAVAGPFAGFALALPAIYFGYSWSKVIPGVAAKGDIVFGTPLVFDYFRELLHPGVAAGDICMHPVLWAAWAGVIATAANLLPVGQLDGGHIVYAWLGTRQLTVSKVVILALIPLGFLFRPWWLTAALLWVFARKHPYIHDEQPLDGTRRLIALAAFFVLAISFVVVLASPHGA